jgi:hypothetical protein
MNSAHIRRQVRMLSFLLSISTPTLLPILPYLLTYYFNTDPIICSKKALILDSQI